MNNLEKQHFLKKENLNETYYFQSILQEAHTLNLLSDSFIENIQMESIRILSNEIVHYTKGESSSVKIETSQNIMQSIFYCIGVYLKSFKDIDISLEVLKQKPLLELLENGKKLILIETANAKELLDSILNDNISTDNYAYNYTIQEGIPIFFPAYDIDFAAHEGPGSIDYPLSNDNMALVGIEYLYNYLKILSQENNFCKNFSTYDINLLLKGYHDHYEDLLINIFELVLANALGCVLANKNPITLNIQPLDRECLQNTLGDLSKDKLDTILQNSCVNLCTQLYISDSSLIKIISNTVINLSSRLKYALEKNQLESIFLSFKEDHLIPVFNFEDGVKMDDELFRNIVNEIRDCRFVSDKIRIIQSEIHSISDLVDILQSYCIFDGEFYDIYQSLHDIQLALLFKNLPTHLIDSDHHFTENEKEWQNSLYCFFEKLDLAKIENIRALAEKLEIR